MSDFLIICLTNSITYLFSCFLLFYAASAIFEITFFTLQTTVKTFFVTLMLSFFISALSLIDLSKQSVIGMEISGLTELISIITLIVYLKRFFPNDSYAVPCLLFSLVALLTNTVMFSTLSFYDTLFAVSHPLINYLLYHITVFVLTLFCLFLWKKTPLVAHVRRLLKLKTLSYGMGMVYIVSESLIFFMMNTSNVDGQSIYYLFAFGYLLLLILISVTAREMERSHQLTYSQQLIQQQQIYLTHLETLQQELRSVQHDYKNVLSGMYLHASEGRVEEIKHYLSENLLSMDRHLQLSIKQQQQLSTIALIEVKSLLLTKLLIAQEHQVTINLEVASPVHRIDMALDDFLKILGITLDNAIESAAETPLALVDLVLLQEEQQIQVIIKNSITQKVSATRIWQTGFSTKGPNRGIGLSNYRTILAKYNNVLSETKITTDTFTHTIMIN